MKTFALIMVIVMSGCVCANTCTEKYWRGHVVQCCSNGTALRVEKANLVWVKERAFLFGVSPFIEAGKIMSRASPVVINASTICCVACHVYYLMVVHCNWSSSPFLITPIQNNKKTTQLRHSHALSCELKLPLKSEFSWNVTFQDFLYDNGSLSEYNVIFVERKLLVFIFIDNQILSFLFFAYMQ